MMTHRTMAQHRYTPDPKRDVKSYDLIDDLPPHPPLDGEVALKATTDELIDVLAAELVACAVECVRQYGDFHLVLTGGLTPQPLYERLMYDPCCRGLPWRRTHLWISDERCVPADHERSNSRAINEVIGMHADIPREQMHVIDAMSDTADVDYEQALRGALEWREPGQDRIDFVLLGLGADGHTASLFPHTAAVTEKDRWVRLNSCLDAEPSDRVTMTLPLINSARCVAVMVTGREKAAIVQRVAGGEESIEELPIMGVAPVDGVLKWYLDKDACAGFEG